MVYGSPTTGLFKEWVCTHPGCSRNPFESVLFKKSVCIRAIQRICLYSAVWQETERQRVDAARHVFVSDGGSAHRMAYGSPTSKLFKESVLYSAVYSADTVCTRTDFAVYSAESVFSCRRQNSSESTQRKVLSFQTQLPPEDPTVGPCLGPYEGPRGVGLFL